MKTVQSALGILKSSLPFPLRSDNFTKIHRSTFSVYIKNVDLDRAKVNEGLSPIKTLNYLSLRTLDIT